MKLILTTKGKQLLDTNLGHVLVTKVQLGDSYGYELNPSLGLRGNTVYEDDVNYMFTKGTEAKYTLFLGDNIGDFDFGELALLDVLGNVIAVGVNNELVEKRHEGVGKNTMRLDFYLDSTNNAYNLWLNLADTNSNYQVASLPTVDLLPYSVPALSNAFVIAGVEEESSAFLAYTNHDSLWSFSEYLPLQQRIDHYKVRSFTATSVTIDASLVDINVASQRPRHLILQFTTGSLRGICRFVLESKRQGNLTTYTFDTPIFEGIRVGDTLTLYSQRDLLLPPGIRIASYSNLGIVQIGNGLLITEEGILSVDDSLLPTSPVLSVNGQTGHVVVDLSQFILTINGAGPDANGNIDLSQYVLPPATTETLGGVIVGQGLTVDVDGRLHVDMSNIVTSVNGMTGDVFIEGLVKSVNNKYPDSDGNIKVPMYQLPKATTETLGGVIVGQGLVISPEGILNVDTSGYVTSVNGQTGDITIDPYVLPKATTETLGGVIVGHGLNIDKEGVLSINTQVFEPPVLSVNGQTGHVEIDPYILRPATPDILGGVIVGQGLLIDTDGRLSVDVTILPKPIEPKVLSVNGQTGDVTVPTYSLPVASNTILGGVRVGYGLLITEEGVLSVNMHELNVPIATKTTAGIVIVGDGLSIKVDGTLSLDIDNLPRATTEKYGVVKVDGTSIKATDGVIEVDWDAMPYATNLTKGVVKLGPEFIKDTNSFLKLNKEEIVASTTEYGFVKVAPDGPITISSDGTLTYTGAAGVETVNGRYPYGGNVQLEGFIDPEVIKGSIFSYPKMYGYIGPETLDLPIPYEPNQQAMVFKEIYDKKQISVEYVAPTYAKYYKEDGKDWYKLEQQIKLANKNEAGSIYVPNDSVFEASEGIISRNSTALRPDLIQYGQRLLYFKIPFRALQNTYYTYELTDNWAAGSASNRNVYIDFDTDMRQFILSNPDRVAGLGGNIVVLIDSVEGVKSNLYRSLNLNGTFNIGTYLGKNLILQGQWDDDTYFPRVKDATPEEGSYTLRYKFGVIEEGPSGYTIPILFSGDLMRRQST